MTSEKILTHADFEFLARYVEEATGIHLKADKEFLLRDRLLPILAEDQLSSFAELAILLQKSPNAPVRKKIIEAITTNETYFFRDTRVFDVLKSHILPDILEINRGKKTRILSAASSTGQEIYSVAMMAHDIFQGKYQKTVSPDDLQLLGIDVSTDALAQARSGSYNEVEIKRGLPEEMRNRFFREDGGVWRAQERITQLVNFRQYNLLDSLPILGKFSLILCRNVLIYFEKATKQKILMGLEALLEPQGVLLVGATENLIGLTTSLERQQSEGVTFHRKPRP